MATPSYSVIVPVFRGERYVPGLLAALAAQSVRPSAVWLAETEPSEAVRALAERNEARYVAVDAADFDHAGTRSRLSGPSHHKCHRVLREDSRLHHRRAAWRSPHSWHLSLSEPHTCLREQVTSGAYVTMVTALSCPQGGPAAY